MNRVQYSLLSLLMVIIINSTALSNSSTPDTTGADLDLAILENFFQNIDHVGCSLAWWEGSDGTFFNYSGKCRVSKNRFLISKNLIDRNINIPLYTELQNDIFNAYVHIVDSTIVVEKPRSACAAVMHIDLLDTLFLSAYVKRMYVTDSLNFRILQVEFNEQAPYEGYRMVYNFDQFMPTSIDMVTKFEATNGGIRLLYSYLYFGNPSFDPLPEGSFSTDSYFLKRNGKFEPTLRYQQYQLFDHTWLP